MNPTPSAEQPPASVQPPREMNEPAKREFAPGLTGSRSVRQSAPPRELPALEELMDRLVEANGSPEGDFTTEEGVLRALCGEALMPLLDYRKLLMGGGASVQESARERAKAWDRTRDPNGLLWEQHPQWYRDRLAVWLASLRPAAAPSERVITMTPAEYAEMQQVIDGWANRATDAEQKVRELEAKLYSRGAAAALPPTLEERFLRPALSPIVNDAFKRARNNGGMALPDAEPFVTAIIRTYEQMQEQAAALARTPHEPQDAAPQVSTSPPETAET